MITLEKYLNEMEANKYSPSTIKTTRVILTTLDRLKPLEKTKKNDLVKFFANFDGAESSLSLYQTVIKKFFKDTGEPEAVSWIRVVRPKETIKPEDIPDQSDINLLIEATDSPYFKALIAFLFEAGSRISEATGDKYHDKDEPLRYKDFIDTTDGMICHIPTTKTAAGYRPVFLSLECSQYIKNLKLYTFANDDDEVFGYSWCWMNEKLKEIAKKAGIKKRITCHVLRHAAATQDTRNGMNEENLRRKYGWAAGSKMPSRYANLNPKDAINAQRRAKGQKQIEEPQDSVKLVSAPTLHVQDGKDLYLKVEQENAELKAKMAQMENILNSMVSALKEGKSPENLFFDKKQDKIIVG